MIMTANQKIVSHRKEYANIEFQTARPMNPAKVD